MFGVKRKRMIDVKELHRKGLIIVPKEDIDAKTDKEGFFDYTKPEPKISPIPEVPQKIPQRETKPVFDFFGNNSSTPEPTENFSTETNGYSKREVDAKLTELDNKIYKMEQRLELVERKTGVGLPQDNYSGNW